MLHGPVVVCGTVPRIVRRAGGNVACLRYPTSGAKLKSVAILKYGGFTGDRIEHMFEYRRNAVSRESRSGRQMGPSAPLDPPRSDGL